MLDTKKLINRTVKPCAISSSGTNSGRNWAGVIHGSFVLTGNKVTIMSPLAETQKISIQSYAGKISCVLTESLSDGLDGGDGQFDIAQRLRIRRWSVVQGFVQAALQVDLDALRRYDRRWVLCVRFRGWFLVVELDPAFVGGRLRNRGHGTALACCCTRGTFRILGHGYCCLDLQECTLRTEHVNKRKVLRQLVC